jgi:hypothetical protein
MTIHRIDTIPLGKVYCELYNLIINSWVSNFGDKDLHFYRGVQFKMKNKGLDIIRQCNDLNIRIHRDAKKIYVDISGPQNFEISSVIEYMRSYNTALLDDINNTMKSIEYSKTKELYKTFRILYDFYTDELII